MSLSSRSPQRPPALPPKQAAAPAPSRSARTRERILRVSLELFNQHGESNVTTGHIADELNISPGNLYYHFRNKDEIIHHLFAEFEKQIDVGLVEVHDVGGVMEDLWLYLHMMFERIWQFRFLYRNLDDLLSRDQKLKSHFNIIIGHKRDAVKSICAVLVDARAMRASASEIDALAENILVVASYWLNYEHIRQRKNADEDPAKHLTRGVYQVMALIAPFLRDDAGSGGSAKAHLDHLMKNYLT